MRHLVLALLLLGCAGGAAPVAHHASAERDTPRGAYVRDAHAWLRDDARSSELVSRARADGITSLTLYGLGPLLADAEGRASLARFMSSARGTGVVELGAPIAGIDRVEAIAAFEREHPEARFDLLVTELEYWNGCGGPPRAECFARFLALLDAMRTTSLEARTLAAYLGYPEPGEIDAIAERVSRVHLNLTIREPAIAFTHVHAGIAIGERWAAFSRRGIDVWPILYLDGEVDLSGWLAGRPLVEAERAVERARVLAEREDLAPAAGYAWFTLDAMP